MRKRKRGEDKEEQFGGGREQRHELLVQTVEEWERQAELMIIPLLPIENSIILLVIDNIKILVLIALLTCFTVLANLWRIYGVRQE